MADMTDTNNDNGATEELLQEDYHTVIVPTNHVCNDIVTDEHCSICYNDIDKVNVTVTRCNHRFHSSCIFQMMANGGRDCPLCRTKLAKDVQPAENYYDDDYQIAAGEWGSDIEEDESPVTSDDRMVTNDEQTYEHSMSIETLTEKLVMLGYTNVDMLRLYIGNSLRTENPEKYTREFCSKLYDDIEDIIRTQVPAPAPAQEHEASETSRPYPPVIQYSIQELRQYYRLISIDTALETTHDEPL